MNRKQKKNLIRIIIAAVLLIFIKACRLPAWLSVVLYLAAYIVIGYDILRKAFKGILNKQVFDENFLMAVATVGAIALAVYERSADLSEAVAVMLFYQIGELFQIYAVGKSRRNIAPLMDIRPDYANIEKDGQLERVDPDEVEIGSVIVVQPGEKVPIDGTVIEGTSSLNTSALTGESLPRDVAVGDEIISGCINMTGVLKIRTSKAFGESTVSKILELVELRCAQVPRGELHLPLCPRLYPGRLLQRSGTRGAAAGHSPHHGHGRRVEHMDLPRAHLPCHQLPLRSGHQHPAQLLCRHRRSEPRGHSHKRFELP